jgi:3-dehydroquinate dehydratase-2
LTGTASPRSAAATTAEPGRHILVLHGPSLSRLGRREPSLYGSTTLAELDARVVEGGRTLGLRVDCRQTNHEGVLIDALFAAADAGTAGVLLNAGAWAHTSLAIADAVRAVAPLPVVEVHLTNTTAREAIRQHSLVGAACRARVEGFGVDSYVVALHGLAALLTPAATGGTPAARSRRGDAGR